MTQYAPVSEQPPLGRTLAELTKEEVPLFQLFSDPAQFEKFIFFMAQEEEKKKAKFRRQYYTFFKVKFGIQAESKKYPYRSVGVWCIVEEFRHFTSVI